MKQDNPLDVFVVGAGPAGSTLAVDLARRGLGVRIVDAAAHAFGGSRAKGVQPRSLEVFDDLGVVDDVVAAGSTYPPLGIHLGPVTVPVRMSRLKTPTPDVPYPNTWLIPQHRTDQALHDRLRTLGRDVEFGHELVDLDQDEATVTATVKVAGGVEQIAARYVVGADGGASTVRKRLGIGFTGSTDEQDRIVIADATVSGLSRDRWHLWPALRGRFTGACPLPHGDQFQWMIRLAPGEQPPADDAELAALIRMRTRNPRIQLREVQWTSVFRPNIRLAARYRHGRVFIAGDAAHVHTPAGAQGLNTGIQDAYNLGWKLGQVLAGADPRLLDTYEAERRPIAAAVLGLTTQKYGAIGKLDPSSIRRGKDEQQLGITYHRGPLAPADENQDAGRTGTLRVGDRAPDATLLDPHGTPTRLFDTFRGPHFTAVAYGPRAARDLDQLGWPAAGAGLTRIVIDPAGPGPGRSFADRGNTFRRAYGLTGDTLLLVRPDGYLAHIATRPGATEIALRAMTPPAESAGAADELARPRLRSVD